MQKIAYSWLATLTLVLLLAGCSHTSAGQGGDVALTPSPPPLATFTPENGPNEGATAPPAEPDPALTLTPSPLPVATFTPVSGQTETPSAPPVVQAPCAYSWAYQEAPGVPEQALQALQAAGLAPARVSAQVYGENCMRQDGGGGFLAMGTTIEAELPVADLADREALGQIVEQVIAALAGIGPTPGLEREARLIFTTGGETTAIKFTLRLAQRHIDQGLGGAELLTALGYEP
jgi:hypothetical protein